MPPRTRWIAGAVGAVAVIGGGTGTGLAASRGADDSQPLTGSTRDRGVAAALAETGGGTVTETEAGDGGAAHGVEVRLEDGRHVEVDLDEAFNVIGQEADDDGPNDNDGPNDD